MNNQITFKALNNVSDEQICENKKVNRCRGIQKVGKRMVEPHLAVVGGSPDIGNFIDELKCFDGEIWAINGAYDWCRSVGINAIFYAIDPSHLLVPLVKNVHKAILADTVHQDIFDYLGDKVNEIVWLGVNDVKYSTTATATAPMVAAESGYKHVTFYGCQSCFGVADTHIYKNDSLSKIWVRCGGVEYITCSQFIMQAEFLAELSRGLPKGILIKGSGFLSSLIEHRFFEVTHVTRSMHEYFERQTNGKIYSSSTTSYEKSCC